MMELSFRIALIVGALVFIILIFAMIKRQKLSVRYSILWLFAALILLLFAAFPYIVLVLRDLLKVEVASNLIFMVVIAFTLLIVLGLSSAVSVFSDQIKRLTQSIAVLEKRVRELEKTNLEK